ncbi:MAG: hypothetical protein NC131_12845 [Roseburia sp.]|nr:hypothetical protein [Roseburia sp.]
MQYRYRVLGKVEQSFILRGAYFAVGSEMDFYITESEMPFVKEMCKLTKVCDFMENNKSQNSMSNVAEESTTPEKPVKRQYNKRKAE